WGQTPILENQWLRVLSDKIGVCPQFPAQQDPRNFARAANVRRCAMNRHLFVLRVTVKDGERAFLMRTGRFERVLEPGRHAFLDPRHELGVELHNVVRAEFPADRYSVLKTARPDLAVALFEAVETKADELAIVSLDGRPTHLMAPWQTRVFW